ncbi:MAG: hypothetical protein ACC652_08600, partial [Acidimicrobiales bacterium]
EHFVLASENDPNTIKTSVMLVESLGSEVLVHFEFGSEQITVDADVAAETTAKSKHSVARFEPTFRASAGESMTIGFQSELAHFFSLETGAAIVD